MKKFVLFAAFAALVLTSCTKESGTGFESNVRTVQFTASSVDTKTVFGTPDGSTYPVLWSDNDSKIGLALNLKSVLSADLTVSADHKTATFTRELSDDASGMYQFVIVNPYDAFKSVNASESRFMVEVPSGQTSAVGTPDERAQVMYGVSDISAELPSKVSLNLKHVPVYLHMSFKGVDLGGATVQSVSVSSEKFIAGRFFLKLDGSYVEGTSMAKSVTVSTESLDDVWCAIAPVDLAGTVLSVSIVTDKGSLNKDLNIPSSFVFSPGKICKLSINMEGIGMKDPVVYDLVTSADELHYGDEIIIAAADYDVALSKLQNTNNRSETGVSKGSGVILDPSDDVEIITLQDGLIPGTWSLYATKTAGYIYAAGGINDAGNYLRTRDIIDEQASWNISFGDFTEADNANPDAERAIIHALTSKRSLMRYNMDSKIFSGYNDVTSTYPVKIYRHRVDPDMSPRFNATMPSDGKTIATSAAELPVYVFGNVSWTASVSGGASLDVTSGKGPATLTLSVPENTTTSTKEYKVTVSTSASVSPSSYTLTVTQNAVPASVDVKVGDILYFENWAGAADGSTNGALDKYTFGGTVVLGGAPVIYSGKGAYTKTDGNANCKVVSGRDETLLITPNGYMTVSGIPCKGVKSATLSYVINRSQTEKYIPSTSTEGVTIGSETQTSEVSGDNTAYILSFPVTFESGVSTFDLTITNKHSANTRFTNIQVVVTDIY